jgi:Type IV secretion system pilin
MKRYTSFLGKVTVICGAILPALAFAQVKIKTFEGLVNKFIDIIQYVIPLIFSIALVAFLWGIFQYFFSGAEKKEEAKDFLLYGIIGLFIMISVWGLVKILTSTFPLDTAQPRLPTLGTGGSSSGSGSSNFNTSTAGGSGGVYYQPPVSRDSGFVGPTGSYNVGSTGSNDTGSTGSSNPTQTSPNAKVNVYGITTPDGGSNAQ